MKQEKTVESGKVLVFKTNIKTKGSQKKAQMLLDTLQDIQASSIDLNDADCVLRVVTKSLSADDIITLLCQAGFECNELED